MVMPQSVGAMGSRKVRQEISNKSIQQGEISYTASNGIEMTVESSDDIIGGAFQYGDGKVTEFLANRTVVGDRVEFTDIAFYPAGAAGNELKNEFGGRAMLQTFEAMKDFAKSQGHKQVRIHFIRANNSSSAKPGKVFDKTFDLK